MFLAVFQEHLGKKTHDSISELFIMILPTYGTLGGGESNLNLSDF